VILTGGGVMTHKKLQIQVLDIFLEERRKLISNRSDKSMKELKNKVYGVKEESMVWPKYDDSRVFLFVFILFLFGYDGSIAF
jgi:hypothetical protein